MDGDSEPAVSGRLAGDSVVCDGQARAELEPRGYGEAVSDRYALAPFEALYLLYIGRLSLYRGKTAVSFDSLMRSCTRRDPDILTKFLIYRDLRRRGYVVKDGFGFGFDFRVYEHGKFGQKGARYLVFGMNEGRQERIGILQKKISEITKMGKEPIIAVVERRGEIIYYKISGTEFGKNTAR